MEVELINDSTLAKEPRLIVTYVDKLTGVSSTIQAVRRFAVLAARHSPVVECPGQSWNSIGEQISHLFRAMCLRRACFPSSTLASHLSIYNLQSIGESKSPQSLQKTIRFYFSPAASP